MNTPNPDLSAALEQAKLAILISYNNAGGVFVWGSTLRALVNALEGREEQPRSIWMTDRNVALFRLLADLVEEARREGAPESLDLTILHNRITDLFAPSPTPAAIPEGWVLVPIEPTEEMLTATREAFAQINEFIVEMAVARGRPLTPHPDGSPLRRAYRAMIAARPATPEAKGPVVDEAMVERAKEAFRRAQQGSLVQDFNAWMRAALAAAIGTKEG